MAGNAETVIDLDKKRMQAMVAKDVAALEAIIADDLIYTHSSARLDTKKSLIEGMVKGTTVYTGCDPSGAAGVKYGRYRVTGSSSRSIPRSLMRNAAAATIGLVTEASRKIAPCSIVRPASRSANPAARA